jgi:hypothetical protein
LWSGLLGKILEGFHIDLDGLEIEGNPVRVC